MNAKIERVCKDIDRVKEKITEQQARLRELEKQKNEFENNEIVDAVRGMAISFDELAELLKTARATSGQHGPKLKAAPKPAAAKAIDNDIGGFDPGDGENKKEDSDE